MDKTQPTIEPSPTNLTLARRLAYLRHQLAQADQYIAAHSPPRPRPWHTKARPEQRPPHDGTWLIYLALAGRGWGKALSLDVRIPTPGGWTTMADINVGDRVFDEHGKPCNVTAVHEVMAEDAYRLSFSDGTSLDACGDHLWATWTHADRKAYLRGLGNDTTRLPADWVNWRSKSGAGPQIRTTQEVVATLTQGSRGDTNHSIPLAGALDLPHATLPIDPYLLGVWLGDGTAIRGHITIGDEDAAEMTELIRACGETVRRLDSQRAVYSVGVRPYARDTKTGRMVGNGGFHTRLKTLGVLGNKHVPTAYLRASAEQRLALLQGLMDSDGYAEASRVEFCSTSRVLADAVVELACSLGQKPVLTEGRAALLGVDHGPKYRVKWRPTLDVFRLERKRARVATLGAQAFRNRHRMIVKAERLPSQPMRCITVDSPNRMYLAGDRMIPTHNSFAGANWLAEQAATHPGTDWAVIAPVWRDCQTVCFEDQKSGLLKAFLPGELLPGPAGYNKSELTLKLTNGSRIMGFSADKPDRLRGKNLSGAWVDELAAMGYAETLWDEALMPALRIGEYPRVFVTTTPRPVPMVKRLVKRDDARIIKVTGATMDNADNLSEAQLAELLLRYDGTRSGRQELLGELLEELDGALWTQDLLDASRVPEPPASLVRIVVGVDPAVTSGENSDYTGIVVAGRSADGHLYILGDYTCKATPRSAMATAVRAYHDHNADRIIAEVNNGHDYIGEVLKTVEQHIPYGAVNATRGKRVRAEPISALWEQGRAHIVGSLPKLEDELTGWTPEMPKSPDRLDAMVWAATELMTGISSSTHLNAISTVCPACQMPNPKNARLCRYCGKDIPPPET